MLIKKSLLITILFSAFLAASASHAAEAITPAPAFSAEILNAPQDEGWITNGGTISNQRYSPLAQINRDNVANLKAVWRTDLDSALDFRHNNQAQPLVYEGVIYIVTGQNDVFAISVETGDILWEYRSGLEEDDAFVCCQWVSRGLGMGDGKIFLGRLDSKMMALDQQTGAVIWEKQLADPKLGYSLTAAPLYYDGMVIIGNAGGDLGTRGRVQALEADTGEQRWIFYTIPGPGEFGHDTWPQDNDVWQWGGAPVWHTPAVDPELGMIYFSTGNAGPTLGGAVRPGDNLFTASILALDVYTGEYRWHFQEVHHDIWDYDAPNPVILFEAEYDGVLRRGLAQAGKTGWIYLLDRLTGEPLLGIEERPVPQEERQATAATQPFPVGQAITSQETRYSSERITLVNNGRIFTPFFEPGIFTPANSVNWPPSAYDPATNTMYICATDSSNGARADATQFEGPTFEQSWNGGTYVGSGLTSRGVYSAFDLTTNTPRWQREISAACRSGSLVTAGGIVFMGHRGDNEMVALDSATGEELWSFRVEAPVNSGFSTFMWNGTQYMVTYAGGGLFGALKGDGVWLFSLEGTLNELPPDAGGNTNQVAVEVPDRQADLESGEAMYKAACVYCHGNTGEGGEGGGAQLTNRLSIGDIMNVLGNGRNVMPNFSPVMSNEQMHDVASYLADVLIQNR